MSELTESAGLRVLVHPQTSMPFPLDEGMSVSAGELTYYAVRKVVYKAHITLRIFGLGRVKQGFHEPTEIIKINH